MACSPQMLEIIKQIHPEYLVLYKEGGFYRGYGEDSIILASIFGYKLKSVKQTTYCGFPKKSLDKIIGILENNKINYLLIDKRNNYEVDEKSDNRNLNKYSEFLLKSKEYLKKRQKINEIANKLNQIKNKEIFYLKINKIEGVLNETREIQSN